MIMISLMMTISYKIKYTVTHLERHHLRPGMGNHLLYSIFMFLGALHIPIYQRRNVESWIRKARNVFYLDTYELLQKSGNSGTQLGVVFLNMQMLYLMNQVRVLGL